MKKILLTILLFASIISDFAVTPSRFGKHSIELALSTGMDYYMFTDHTAAMQGLRKLNHDSFFPFIGFNIGVNYIYRPSKLIGLSAGINHQLYGRYFKINWSSLTFDDGFDVNPGITPSGGGYTEGFHYNGMLTIPLTIHFSVSAPKSDFEFITGPKFYIPFYQLFYIKSNNIVLDPPWNSQFYSSDQVKRTASFGWVFATGAHIPVHPSFSMFVGPELKLINPVYFHNSSSAIDFTLAIKVALRFYPAHKAKEKK